MLCSSERLRSERKNLFGKDFFKDFLVKYHIYIILPPLAKAFIPVVNKALFWSKHRRKKLLQIYNCVDNRIDNLDGRLRLISLFHNAPSHRSSNIYFIILYGYPYYRPIAVGYLWRLLLINKKMSYSKQGRSNVGAVSSVTV